MYIKNLRYTAGFQYTNRFHQKLNFLFYHAFLL